MNKIYKNIIKSLIIGVLILGAFLFILGNILNGKDAGIMIVGISIISTIIYCTYTIIDTIKEYCGR